MSEFPRDDLVTLASYFEARVESGKMPNLSRSAAQAIRQAIKAHEELGLRCVEDRTRDSITIGQLRARIQELEKCYEG